MTPAPAKTNKDPPRDPMIPSFVLILQRAKGSSWMLGCLVHITKFKYSLVYTFHIYPQHHPKKVSIGDIWLPKGIYRHILKENEP